MSHPPHTTGMVQQLRNEGISALRNGEKLRARKLLAQALKINPRDAQSWLWLSGAVDTPVEQRFCLERLRDLCPNHPAVLEGLAQLDHITANGQPDYRPLTKAPAVQPADLTPTSLEPVRLSAPEQPDDQSDMASSSASATQGWLRSLLDMMGSVLL